jgi:hypothetical protein
MFDDELAEDEESASPLATQSFVAYRLCPSDDCSECSTIYGRYVVDLETYMENVVENQAQAYETMCENCQDRCNTDDDSCSDCGRKCYRYENYASEGYVDASEFMECQQLEWQGDDDNNNNNNEDAALYIGPRCSYDGAKIVIGVFSDEDCVEPVYGVDVEEMLGAKLSYHLLSHTTDSSDNSTVCLSCMEDDNDGNENDQQDADDVNEMCENLYTSAAKCESKTGIEVGFIQTSQENGQYENQVENEYMACTFIDSLIWNSYTETGEIDIYSAQDVYIRKVTNNQAMALSFLVLTMFGLFAGKAYFDRKLEMLGPAVPFGARGNRSLI